MLVERAAPRLILSSSCGASHPLGGTVETRNW